MDNPKPRIGNRAGCLNRFRIPVKSNQPAFRSELSQNSPGVASAAESRVHVKAVPPPHQFLRRPVGENREVDETALLPRTICHAHAVNSENISINGKAAGALPRSPEFTGLQLHSLSLISKCKAPGRSGQAKTRYFIIRKRENTGK